MAIYEEGIEMSEVGVYTPHFDFDTSEIYKENITAIKQKQKDMIKSGEAVKIQTEWEINGSKAKGRVMAKQAISLALRSFNNECDVTIANTIPHGKILIGWSRELKSLLMTLTSLIKATLYQYPQNIFH